MLDNAESETKSLEGGRKASSARARKSLQNIKTSCHNLRKAVTQHTKFARPTFYFSSSFIIQYSVFIIHH